MLQLPGILILFPLLKRLLQLFLLLLKRRRFLFKPGFSFLRRGQLFLQSQNTGGWSQIGFNGQTAWVAGNRASYAERTSF